MGERRSPTSVPSQPRVRAASAATLQRTPLPGAAPVAPVPDRDIRSRPPLLLSFMLRVSTIRRFCRVLALLALDFAGVALAIFTALVLKEAVHGAVTPENAL